MNRSSNFELSRGIFLGQKLIGVYLLNNEAIPSFKGKSVYGLSLALLPEYRNQGYGKLLIEYGESLPFDYIWGKHAPELNNLDHWLKRRTLLTKDDHFFITYKLLKNRK